jgi:glutathione S-transferase
MNIEASLPEVGARIWAEQEGVRRNLARLESAWADALAESGGPFLFGRFCAADAFFAPVVMRLQTYALPVSDNTREYMARVAGTPPSRPGWPTHAPKQTSWTLKSPTDSTADRPGGARAR